MALNYPNVGLRQDCSSIINKTMIIIDINIKYFMIIFMKAIKLFQ